MLAQEVTISSLAQLRRLVNEIMCEYDGLEPGVFPVTERILVRGDSPCGIFFCLHGPRSVKYTAIWETDRNSILFYGHDGERFRRIQLMDSFRLSPLAPELSAA